MLVLIEAMKMENEIVAPHDGVIGAIPVAKGASVSTGDVKYYASADGDGEPVTDPTSGQKLFIPISSTQLAINLGA